MKTRAQQVIRSEIRALSAYHVADASGMIKLDAMENPYNLPSALQARIGQLCAEAPLNRYPDPAARPLVATLRQALALPEDMALLLGNGSDEIIQILAMAVARPNAVILGVEPSFVMYRMIATFCNLQYVGVPLTADFSLDLPALLAAIEAHQPALIFLAYPNNPTGNLFDRTAIETVLQRAPGLVVLDEAYHAFASDSFMDDLGRYPNMLVMRTLSKLGLAGLRLGFLVGHSEWINELDKVRLPYNINVLTQRVADEVLQQVGILNEQAGQLRQLRESMLAELAGIPGVTAFPSQANFVLIRVADAGRIFQAMKQAGVLVKCLDGGHPLLAGCLRLTVGSATEVRRVLDLLRALL